ncbi:MAG: NAD-dependent epimerase/dehydratase family protein [Gammaproteobacteria bacterium]
MRTNSDPATQLPELARLKADTRGEVDSLAPMRIVMLGCGGFIGSHLLDYLVPNESLQIVGWDPSFTKIDDHLDAPNFELHRKTLQDAGEMAQLEDAIAGADIVINLAAVCNPSEYNTRPLLTIYSNLIDSYPIVELCSKHGKWLLHFSTSEVYGRTISSYVPGEDYANESLFELREDETPLVMGPICNQRWSYASAKQVLERFIYAHHCERSLPFTTIRPLNFFGPRMDYIPGRDGEGVPRVLACFMQALLDDQPMQLVDGGLARRTIVSVHDAMAALVRVLARPAQSHNQIFNIGNRANEVNMDELAHLMRRLYADISGKNEYADHPIETVSGTAFYGQGYEDCDRRMPNIDRARERLGWEPRISLEDTLRETIGFYYDAYGVDTEATAA